MAVTVDPWIPVDTKYRNRVGVFRCGPEIEGMLHET